MSGPSAEQWTALNREVAETKAYARGAKEDIAEIKKWIGEVRDDHEARLRTVERKTNMIWTALGLFGAAMVSLATWIKLGVLK